MYFYMVSCTLYILSTVMLYIVQSFQGLLFILITVQFLQYAACAVYDTEIWNIKFKSYHITSKQGIYLTVHPLSCHNTDTVHTCCTMRSMPTVQHYAWSFTIQYLQAVLHFAEGFLSRVSLLQASKSRVPVKNDIVRDHDYTNPKYKIPIFAYTRLGYSYSVAAMICDSVTFRKSKYSAAELKQNGGLKQYTRQCSQYYVYSLHPILECTQECIYTHFTLLESKQNAGEKKTNALSGKAKGT